MEYAKNHRLLLVLAISGAIISFAASIISGFYSMAIGVGGHGDAAVLASSRYGDTAGLLFFLAMLFIVVAVLLRKAIRKLEKKNSEQNK